MSRLVDQENRLIPHHPPPQNNSKMVDNHAPAGNNIQRYQQHITLNKPTTTLVNQSTTTQTSSFSIYCDNPKMSGSYTSKNIVVDTNKRTAYLTGTDKENAVPTFVKVEKSTAVQTQVLRAPTTQRDDAGIPRTALAVVRERTTVIEANDSLMDLETEGNTDEKDISCDNDDSQVDISIEPEYAQDTYLYLCGRELKFMPRFNYMAKQGNITHNMRSILIDWLVDVQMEYQLQTETLHLAVNYIDRFLSLMAVQREKLQLVGATCMFLAAKYEEIYPPDVSEFVYITDDTYTTAQVLRMEHLVLKVLKFDLSVPTAHLFINKIIESMSTEDETSAEDAEIVEHLANFLSELALVEGQDGLQYRGSLLAASCVVLARRTLGLFPVWTDYIADKTGYSRDDVANCTLWLHSVFCKAEGSTQQAVREKYQESKFRAVADLSPPALT
eukprot:TRINITY_DN1962_c0_g1_i3.p1 TRINITY_DN1962_c0_g1~~TRINITY_DN1962_c0_g1_i3.p1  ORF type:complete len:443 (-),score=89.76 TRINITY_DN1962_c0_g1_i3:180-1508(-)